MQDLKTKILETVKNNNIRMIPKWKFVLYSCLTLVSVVFTFLLSIFFFSLLLYVLSRYGFMYMPFFGFMATLQALGAIPLLLLACAVVLVILTELITRYYSFSFKRPLVVTLFISTSIALLIGFVISETGMHDHMRSYAKGRHIDMMSKMYDRPVPLRKKGGQDVLRGVVVAASSSVVSVKTFDGATIIAYATTSSSTALLITPKIGDDIVLFGSFIGDTFRITAVKPVPHMPFPKREKQNGMHMQEKLNAGVFYQ